MKRIEETVINPGLSREKFCVADFIDPLREIANDDLHWSAMPVAKGVTLLRQGDLTENIFVLESGLVKLTYQKANGDEWIKSFIADCGIFGSINGNSRASPSRFSAVCLESSAVVRLPLSWVQKAIATNPQLQATYLGFTAWLQQRKELREEALLCESAEGRYRLFLEQNSELVSRLSQGDIARFLGITPIAFSRIKRRMLTASQLS